MSAARLVTGGIGALATLIGLALLTRPFASLTLLMVLVVVGLLVQAATALALEPRPWEKATVAAAAGYALAALAILLWPGSAVRVVVWVVGLVLIVEGIAGGIRALRVRGPGRLTAGVRGAGTLVLGVLALIWPDVPTLVIAVLFGIKVLWAGLELVFRAVRGSVLEPGRPDGVPSVWRRGASFLVAAATLAFALVLALIGLRISDSTPVPDAFCTAPASLPAEPGALLGAEAFDRAIPKSSQAWRILYTTTGLDGEPALASGIVVAPGDADGDLPVVAWAHGTTGVPEGCAPSLLENPFSAGAMPALDDAIANGWVVASDYIGSGTEGPHAYLVGEPTGHAVLDGVRAARQMDQVSLSDQTVVWGHSQGGHAALWAGILTEDYTPDAGVIGVAAIAPVPFRRRASRVPHVPRPRPRQHRRRRFPSRSRPAGMDAGTVRRENPADTCG
jgi:uncharacterized membrane protein HdeD (DUF308 family)